ncbi:MAG: ATP-binding cassette domain-containing protein, partial [Actinomycetota bacterium]
VLILATRDQVVTTVLLLFAPAAAGWIAGGCARTAVAACVADIRPAASGVVVAWSLVGLAVAGHVGLVTRGSGAPRAAGWALAYTIGTIVSLAGAARALPRDRRRIALRARWEGPATDAGERTATEDALRIESVTVAFGANTVLDGTSLRVAPGELMALVGGNGAGKSTLLKAAAGFVPVRSGRVLVAGDDVTTLQPEERAAAGLAFVSGARPVFPDLTVLDNLRVAAFRTHPTARSFATAAEAVLSLVPAVAARRRVPAGVLSGGEQRLLAVAQTLFRRPVVLFADELSLGLDFEARLAVLDLLRLLADQGVCVVVVDHDLPSLLPRAHRAALLDRGSIEVFDKPAELLTHRADLLPATFLAGATV